MQSGLRLALRNCRHAPWDVALVPCADDARQGLLVSAKSLAVAGMPCAHSVVLVTCHIKQTEMLTWKMSLLNWQRLVSMAWQVVHLKTRCKVAREALRDEGRLLILGQGARRPAQSSLAVCGHCEHAEERR